MKCSEINIRDPFVPHSKGGVTPTERECLDGTMYVAPNGDPYIVFCHEYSTKITKVCCDELLG